VTIVACSASEARAQAAALGSAQCVATAHTGHALAAPSVHASHRDACALCGVQVRRAGVHGVPTQGLRSNTFPIRD
jgi:hypothetical protein